MTQLDEARRMLRSLQRERKHLERNDVYFEGEQPLRHISPILERELDYRISPIVLNLAQFAVDVYDQRLDVLGFRVGSSIEADNDLRDAWQANEGPMLSQQLTREQLALGRGYAYVGGGEDGEDAPALTIESPFDAIHEDDPRTKRVKHGIKEWTDLDKTRWLTYAHQEGTATWRYKSREWVEQTDMATEGNSQKLCALVPFMNDPRMLGRVRAGKPDQRIGRSVFHSVISPLDGLNKFAYDMMVSGEFHALPRRFATGLNSQDFLDENDKPMKTFSLIAGRLWGTNSEKAKFGQFPEASLSNFHDTIKLLMQIIAMELGLPGHYLLFQGDNPPSADAIRSSESQLVKRAERKQTVLGARWEQVQRLVLMEMGRDADAKPKQIETQWGDPSTPTVAQKADAIVKLVQARDASGRSIVPIEQARVDMGYSDTQQAHMRDWDQNSQTNPQIASAVRRLEVAAGDRT